MSLNQSASSYFTQQKLTDSPMELVGDLLFCIATSTHLHNHPYTKVEESFNLQAVHDFLEIGVSNLSSFDHLEFPGVVPRTFLGPLIVSAIASPCHFIRFLMQYDQFMDQFIVRASLGLIAYLCFRKFRQGVSAYFGKVTGMCLGVVMAVQFHIPFYITRTLPNTFALMILMVAYGHWFKAASFKMQMRKNHTEHPQGGYICIGLMILATVIFRCDVLVIAAPIGLSLLYSDLVTFAGGIMIGIKVGIFALCLTISLDSFMWRRWLWPEGEVFFFNTVENKSSEWGILPPHWYFTSALPRAFVASIIWMIIGVLPVFKKHRENPSFWSLWMDVSTLPWLLPAFISISLYSFLPHKELRFIFPALPLFNVTAAYGLGKVVAFVCELEKQRITPLRSLWKGFSICFLIIAPTVLCILALLIFSDAAHWNYPGGDAFTETHNIFANHKNLKIHIDGAAAETGVSRFGENNRPTHTQSLNWTYSKDESLKQPHDFLLFDVLLTGKEVSYFDELKTSSLEDTGSCPFFVTVYQAHGIGRLALTKRPLFSASKTSTERVQNNEADPFLKMIPDSLTAGIENLLLSLLNKSSYLMLTHPKIKLPERGKQITKKVIEVLGGNPEASTSFSMFNRLYIPMVKVEPTPKINVLANAALAKAAGVGSGC